VNLTLVDHLLVLCTTVVLPIHDLLFWYPRLVRAHAGHIPRARFRAYRDCMVVEWSLFAATLGWWAFRDRPWDSLGFAAPGGWGFWLGVAVALSVIVVITRQRLALSRDPEPEVREAVLAQLENLKPLLPHTRQEFRQFSLMSFTAGVCEETLFRGLLIWYLDALVPTVVALFVAAALFGMAHAYQGTRGVAQTGLVGLGLVVLYVITGTLWVPIVVHAFFDLNSGLLAYTFLRADGNHTSLDTPPTGS
jgi:membrane protease YdiL (CAAX protease family)